MIKHFHPLQFKLWTLGHKFELPVISITKMNLASIFLSVTINTPLVCFSGLPYLVSVPFIPFMLWGYTLIKVKVLQLKPYQQLHIQNLK